MLKLSPWTTKPSQPIIGFQTVLLALRLQLSRITEDRLKVQPMRPASLLVQLLLKLRFRPRWRISSPCKPAEHPPLSAFKRAPLPPPVGHSAPTDPIFRSKLRVRRQVIPGPQFLAAHEGGGENPILFIAQRDARSQFKHGPLRCPDRGIPCPALRSIHGIMLNVINNLFQARLPRIPCSCAASLVAFPPQWLRCLKPWKISRASLPPS